MGKFGAVFQHLGGHDLLRHRPDLAVGPASSSELGLRSVEAHAFLQEAIMPVVLGVARRPIEGEHAAGLEQATRTAHECRPHHRRKRIKEYGVERSIPQQWNELLPITQHGEYCTGDGVLRGMVNGGSVSSDVGLEHDVLLRAVPRQGSRRDAHAEPHLQNSPTCARRHFGESCHVVGLIRGHHQLL